MASKPRRSTVLFPTWQPRQPPSFPTGKGEPRTLEGRARKKLQLGQRNSLGCVLSFAEMQLLIQLLPPQWMEKECK